MNLTSMVRQFHTTFNRPLDLVLAEQTDGKATAILLRFEKLCLAMAEENKELAVQLQGRDERLYRAYLMLEELGELLGALARNDYVETADGCGDLKYVVEGTAVTFRVPSAEVEAEIHRSNMTKQAPTLNNPRVRGKGPNYSPPDIEKAIETGMRRVEWEKTLEANEEISMECMDGLKRAVITPNEFNMGLRQVCFECKKELCDPCVLYRRTGLIVHTACALTLDAKHVAELAGPNTNNDGDPLNGVI